VRSEFTVIALVLAEPAPGRNVVGWLRRRPIGAGAGPSGGSRTMLSSACRSDCQRELLDAESVAGHLLKADSVFAFLAVHRKELFPGEMFADLFTGPGRADEGLPDSSDEHG
jgi:hypothetical protein